MASGAKGQTSKIVVWIILVLLIIGLAGFGAGSFGGQVTSVGSVGDTEIDVDQYARELDQELRALSGQLGQNISLADAQQFGVDQQVLQRLIATTAMKNEAGRLGLSIGDEEVRRQVLQTRAFSGLDGQFDRDAYEFSLDQIGISPNTYEESIRTDGARGILEAAISGGVNAPSAYSEIILDYVGERRNFSWITLDGSTLAEPVPAPNDADLQAYYDANKDTFMLPETKEFTYAWLSPDAVIGLVTEDEDALRGIYEDRSAEYNQPERRLVERLVFEDADAAQTAFEQLTASTTTFDSLVTDRGLTLQDVDMGDVAQSALGGAGDAVFALAEPGVVGPIDTDLGPALFRVNAILSARSTPFEDVRDKLQAEYASDAARRIVSDQIQDLEDLLAGGATLEDLAAETDMLLDTISWAFGDTDGIAAYPAFGEAASSAQSGDFPEIIEMEDGGVFALRLDTLLETRPEPIDDARDAVATAWTLEETNKRLTVDAGILTAQLDNGARIGTLGYPVTVETHVTRNAFIEGTSREFLSEIFTLDTGDNLLIQGSGVVWIAQVTEVLPPEANNPDAEALRQAVATETAQGIAQDMLDAFARSTQQQAGITINQAALNAIHAQFP